MFVHISIFLILVASMFAQDEIKSFQFMKSVSLADAAKEFNQRFKADLVQLNSPELSEQEIINALAIGGSDFYPQSKSEVKDFCVDCYRNKSLPAGAYFVLSKGQSIGPSGSEHHEKFIFIYICLTAGKVVPDTEEIVDDDEAAKKGGKFAVRLVPLSRQFNAVGPR
jgi:hypothetical protein